jgi:hypothetical protein
MRKILSLIIAGILAAVSLSATNVSGLISSDITWNLAGSPYVVTGNILVAENVTLRIDPGVVVRFDAAKSIQVNGILVAKGNGSDSIVFTSNTTASRGAWGNLYFTDSSADGVVDANGNYISGSVIEYCSFAYGGKIEAEEVPMVRLHTAKPLIRHSAFRQAMASGIGYYDLTTFSDSSFFDNNSFRDCNTGFLVQT